MIKSCIDCPQCIVKEIEPELPAFCLYWREGLLLENPICRNYMEGRIPEKPIPFSSDLTTAPPHGSQECSEDCQAPEGADTFDLDRSQALDQNSSHHQDSGRITSSQVGPPIPGRYLVIIRTVKAYLHNFPDYTGPRARLRMEILEGPDAGKFLFDNVSLLHPKESKGMGQRRVRIAYRLGLIPRGTEETIQINWKLLEGVVCWVDVDYKNLGGRIVPTVDNYELQ